MSIAGIIGLVLICLNLLLNAIMLAAGRLRKQQSLKLDPEFSPAISILVAARNEETTLPQCLDALLALDYPVDKVTIWVGDDSSSDNTLLILKKYAQKYPGIRYMSITEKLGKAFGKANVLAHLAREAKGDYLFFTDADTTVPRTWISELLPRFTDNTGMVVGVTLVSDQRLWAKLQCNDWALAQYMLKIVSDYHRPATGMGNNMAMSRKAYHSTGGFENIPPSIVEDFEMFRAVRQAGYRVRHVVNGAARADTLPVSGLYSLLHQRKRWMVGASRIHWFLRSLLFLQAVYYPALVLAAICYPLPALAIGLLKTALQASIIIRFLSSVKRKSDIISAVTFEFYSATLSLALIFFYLLPIRISWKNRKY